MGQDNDHRFSRRKLMKLSGSGALALGAGAGSILSANERTAADNPMLEGRTVSDAGDGDAAENDAVGVVRRQATVAADPVNIPPPIQRSEPKTHEIELVAEEVLAHLSDEATHRFMTFNGQVPPPMIRVRQGDTIKLTLTNSSGCERPHNVDCHAVYGTGGGAAATLAAPGESKQMRFKCTYPGAFIYHCAVPNLDEHISRGMFGMILVEPEQGLPPVDREFYLGQHEIYTDGGFCDPGENRFSYELMHKEMPTYVLFNGAVAPFTEGRFGRMEARRGETVRVFMVCGGPNLTSNFHPIGNVWTRFWPQGSLVGDPMRYVQTYPIAPGSCAVGDMELPVPETIKLVDHALSRVARKGLLAEIEVAGESNPEVFAAQG